MKARRNQRNTLLLLLISVVLVCVLPAAAFGQGRGRGRGQEKKWDRFINRHDARDGRWDGRGPRIDRRIYWNDGFFARRAYRDRHYRFDRDFDRHDFRRFDSRNRVERRSWRWDGDRRHQWQRFSRWRW